MKIVYFSTPSFADCDFPLIKELKRQGHDVYYFMDLPACFLKTNIVSIEKQVPENGIFSAYRYKELALFKDYLGLDNFFVVNRLENSILKWSNIKILHQLRKKIGEINPDVINYTGFVGVEDWLLLIRERKRMSLTLHDPLPHSGSTRLRNRINVKFTMLFARYFVFLNDNLAKIFIEKNNLSKEHTLLNRLGPYECTNLFLNQARNISVKKHKPYILFYGRIQQYKGIEYLCRAMERVHEEIPDAKLIIAGSGKLYFDFTPYQNKEYIELINRYISMAELAELLNGCTANVLPYTDATQSGVVLTTFAMGKPVIATNVGGMAEYIETGRTGILVPPRDVDALSNAIVTLLKSPKKVDEISENIYTMNSSEDGGWRGIARKYIDFYQRIVSSNGGK